MAKYYDIDTSVRINGGLTVNGDIIIPSTYGLDAVGGTIKATTISGGTLKGDGSNITNLSSSAMTDVLKLDGSRIMTGSVKFPSGANIFEYNGGEIGALLGGTSNGLLLSSGDNKHVVVELRANDDNDSFSVVSSTGTVTSGHVINSVPFRVLRTGDVTAGRDLTVKRDVFVTGNIVVNGTVDGVDISVFKSSYDSHNHNSQYLGISAKASDSDKLDNLDSSQFLRSDVSDNMEAILKTNQIARGGAYDNSSAYLRMNAWLPNKMINGNGEWNNGYGWTTTSGNIPTSAHEAESGRYLLIPYNSKHYQDILAYNNNTLSIAYSSLLGSNPINLTIQELSHNKATVIATHIDSLNFHNKVGSQIFTTTSGNGPDGNSHRYIRVIVENTDSISKRVRLWLNYGSNAYMSYGLEEDFYELTNRLFDSNWDLKSNENKIWHQGNDGSGSGLDADLLDGLNSGSFMRSDASTSTTGDITIGTGTTVTLTNQNGGLKAYGSNGYIELGPQNTSYAHIYTDRPEFYFNKELKVNGSKVWTAGNDGSGSGLDADLLDGLNSTQFLRSDVNTNLGADLTLSGGVRYINMPTSKIRDNNAYALILSTNGAGTIYMRPNGDASTSWQFLVGADGTITYGGNKIWHAGNDGSGSGLDADLLDGLNSTQFLRNDASGNTAGNFTMYKNLPVLLVQQDSAIAGNAKIQVKSAGSDNTAEVHINNVVLKSNNASSNKLEIDATDGIYLNSNKVWTAGNDGADSGLDADLLDGLNSTQFLRSDTSGTLTGTLNITASTNPALELRSTGGGTPHIDFSNDSSIDFDARIILLGNDSLNIDGVSNTGFTVLSNTVWHAGNGGSGSGLDADTVDGMHADKFARGSYKSYSSVSGDDGTDGWYTLFYVSDTTNTPIMCNIRAYAHTSASFIVSKGYSTSNAMITLLNANVSSVNGGYKYLKGLRILTDGAVQVKLNGGATVNIQVQLISNGSDASLQSSLVKETGSPSVAQSIDPIVNGSLVSKGNIYVDSNVVWHSGNDGAGSGLDADLLDGLNSSQFIRNDVANQSISSGFTMSGTAYVGASNSTGSLIIRKTSGANGIQLAGDNAVELAGVGSYINANGDAKFDGTVQVGTIQVDTTTLVSNLNAEMVGGKEEKYLAKNQSVSELGGKGVYSGLNVVAQTVPNMTVKVNAGTAYTDSGMRKTYSDTSISLATASGIPYDRIDVIYIKGSSANANEGDIAYIQGTPSAVPAQPSIPSDAIKLASIYVYKNIGSIQNSHITDERGWRPFKTINGNVEVWTNLYMQTGSIITSTFNNVVEFGKPIKNTGTNTSLTFTAGQTSKTWTHNKNLTSYVVRLSCNSFEPHVRWTNKTVNAITIELDDICEADVVVDVSIEAY